MSASKPALYEGMFLFNSTAIQSNVHSAMEILRETLERAEAEIVSMYKWDERRLAYPIDGEKRGLYMLVYFRVRGTQIPNIERDVTLSEEMLRCMILRGDHIGEAELELAQERANETRSVAALEQAGEDAEGAGEDQPATEAAAADPEAAALADEGEGESAPASETQER